MDGSRVLQVPPELPLKDKAKLPNNNSGISQEPQTDQGRGEL